MRRLSIFLGKIDGAFRCKVQPCGFESSKAGKGTLFCFLKKPSSIYLEVLFPSALLSLLLMQSEDLGPPE